MSDNGAFTGAVVGAAFAVAAERERERLDDEAREIMAFFDPKTADIGGRRAYAKAVFRIDGSGDDVSASVEDRVTVAVLMMGIIGGFLWGWFGLAYRLAYGNVVLFDHLMGAFFGGIGVVVALFAAGLVWMGLRYVATGRT